MSLPRKILISLSIISITGSLSACGFTPLHGKDTYSSGTNASGEAVTADLSSIKVAEINLGHSGQLMRINLENLLNPMQKPIHPAFRLEVSLQREKQAQLVEIDREITRYKMIATAKYRLIQLADGKEVYHNTAKSSASFDAVTSDYSTYTAEEDSYKRLLQELARDIRFKLAAHLMDLPQAQKVRHISGAETTDVNTAPIGESEPAAQKTSLAGAKRITRQ